MGSYDPDDLICDEQEDSHDPDIMSNDSFVSMDTEETSVSTNTMTMTMSNTQHTLSDDTCIHTRKGVNVMQRSSTLNTPHTQKKYKKHYRRPVPIIRRAPRRISKPIRLP